MPSINIAVVGVGNCASSLVQGLSHYRDGANERTGLMPVSYTHLTLPTIYSV